MYDHDMNGEDKVIFEMPDGWHDFEIVKMEEATSKQNNAMFKVSMVASNDAGTGTDVYLMNEAGKRWFLKQLLTACGVESDENGHMLWDIPDIEGKIVQGRVEHQQEPDWIDRKGATQKGKMKARIVEFKKM